MNLKRFLKILGPLDVFSVRAPGPSLKGQPRLYSCYGIILSLIIFGCLLGLFIFFCQRLESRQYPSFYNFEEPDATTNQRILVFTPKVYQMGFGLELDNNIIANNTIYRIIAVLHCDTQSFVLETEACTPNHFDNKFDPPNGLLCFKEEQIFGKAFVTGWGQVPETWIEMNFTRCDPKKYVCTSDEEINTILQKSQWVTYYPEYLINPLNYANPLTLKYMETPRSLKTSSRKQLKMTLRRIDFLSNNNLLFDEPIIEKVMTLKGIDEEEASLDNNGVFLRATLVNSGIVFHYNRSYPKIQDVLAQVCGLSGTLFSIFILITFPYATAKMYEYIVNNTFEIQNKKKKTDSSSGSAKAKKKTKLSLKKKKSETREIFYRQDQPRERLDTYQDNEEHENQSEIPNVDKPKPDSYSIELPEPSKDKIKITFGKWLKSLFMHDADMSLINKGREFIDEQMDLNMLLMKILELERLKDCIFTPEQRILFENFPKPKISLDYEQGNMDSNKTKMKGWVTSYKVDEKKFKEIYKNLEDKPQKSELDIQLLSLYERQKDL